MITVAKSLKVHGIPVCVVLNVDSVANNPGEVSLNVASARAAGFSWFGLVKKQAVQTVKSMLTSSGLAPKQQPDGSFQFSLSVSGW